MSDFVDKLRSAVCRGCECDECLLMRASAAEIERLREQLVRYQQALRDIVEPVAALKRYADEHDRELDGHLAVQLAKSADHLKGIARAALTDDLRDPDEGLPTADDVRGLPSPKQKAA